MKIPQRPQQTVLGSTQAAGARVSGPVEGVYAGRESGAMQVAAEGLNRVGQALSALDAQQKKLNTSSFEASAQQAYKEYAVGLEKDNNYEGYSAKYEDFEKNLEEQGRKILGESEYDVWRAGAGKTFFAGAALGTQTLAVERKGEKMRTGLADTLNQYATLAAQAKTPAQMEAYRAKAAQTLQEAYMPSDGATPWIDEKQRRVLSDDFEKSAGFAYLERQIQKDPDSAAVDLADPEKYKIFSPQERQQWQNRALKGVLENVKNEVWNVVSKHRMNTGEVNLAAAEGLIREAGYDEQTQQEIMTGVTARMADEKRVREQQSRAQDESFYQAADKLVQSGGGLADGLKLAEQYASDGKDKFTKEKFIQGLFDEKSSGSLKSNPEEYLRLWKGVQDASIGETEIKKSFNAGLLGSSDYRQLVKDNYGDSSEKEGRSFALKQIELMTAAKIADKNDRAVFMLEVKRQTQGQKPEEMVSTAKDLLKEVDVEDSFFDKPKYQADFASSIEQQRVMGKYMLKSPRGRDYMNAITQAIRDIHKDPNYSWSEEDVNDFIKPFENRLFEKGTPENNAMEALLGQKARVTRANLEAAIDYVYKLRGQKSPLIIQNERDMEKLEKIKPQLEAQRRIVERLKHFLTPIKIKEFPHDSI